MPQGSLSSRLTQICDYRCQVLALIKYHFSLIKMYQSAKILAPHLFLRRLEISFENFSKTSLPYSLSLWYNVLQKCIVAETAATSVIFAKQEVRKRPHTVVMADLGMYPERCIAKIGLCYRVLAKICTVHLVQQSFFGRSTATNTQKERKGLMVLKQF